jgi:hypothetical protein
MDFTAAAGLCRRMDQDRADLVAQLLTRVGMMMEDASARALSVQDRSESELRMAIADLLAASDRIETLLRAAAALI